MAWPAQSAGLMRKFSPSSRSTTAKLTAFWARINPASPKPGRPSFDAKSRRMSWCGQGSLMTAQSCPSSSCTWESRSTGTSTSLCWRRTLFLGSKITKETTPTSSCKTVPLLTPHASFRSSALKFFLRSGWRKCGPLAALTSIWWTSLCDPYLRPRLAESHALAFLPWRQPWTRHGLNLTKISSVPAAAKLRTDFVVSLLTSAAIARVFKAKNTLMYPIYPNV